MLSNGDNKTNPHSNYIKESQEIKDRIEHDLKSSFFTKLARGQQNIKGAIQKCKMITKQLEMSIKDGEKIKHKFFAVQSQQEEALMKVLNDINSEKVVSQLREKGCGRKFDIKIDKEETDDSKQSNSTQSNQANGNVVAN